MITYGGVEYRNLVEQVRQNKDDIARHYAVDRVLADFGIRVIGQVNYASQLPAAATYEGEYGDAYVVGTAAPYTFYVWTRANDVNPRDFWFDIGVLAIVGPAGPTGPTGEAGPQGEAGERGGRWVVSPSAIPTNPITGDCYLNSSGTVLSYDGTQWLTGVSLLGPAGPQGNPGPTGATGATGPAGYTPVKGVDYWTAADVATLVSETTDSVLAALPLWEGGEY